MPDKSEGMRPSELGKDMRQVIVKDGERYVAYFSVAGVPRVGQEIALMAEPLADKYSDDGVYRVINIEEPPAGFAKRFHFQVWLKRVRGFVDSDQPVLLVSYSA